MEKPIQKGYISCRVGEKCLRLSWLLLVVVSGWYRTPRQPSRRSGRLEGKEAPFYNEEKLIQEVSRCCSPLGRSIIIWC